MKKIYTTALFLALFSYGNAQGLPNETCVTAQIISIPYTEDVDASQTVNRDIIRTCTGAMYSGVWYTFPGNGGEITIAVTNVIGWDAEIGLYKDGCSVLTCVSSKDDTGRSGSERLTINTMPGVLYHVNIGNSGDGISEGLFKLNITTAPLATQSFDDSAFQSHPNPVKDILNLSYNAKISNVSVFNLLGQKVLTKSVNANEAKIDMAHLSNGTYTVKVTAGNELKTIKVVKQ